MPLITSDDVWAITATPDGCLWFGTFGGGLYRLDPQERLTRFLPAANDPRSLPAENVLALAVDSRGDLWAGTTQGLARWDGSGFESVPIGSLSGAVVFSLSAERDGSLWIGTAHGLDHRLADGRIEQPAWRSRLPDPVVTSVLRDREGTRWITTRHGMVRERDGVVDGLQQTASADRSMTMSLEDGEGGLWFASKSDGLLRLPAGWRHFAVFGKGSLSTLPCAWCGNRSRRPGLAGRRRWRHRSPGSRQRPHRARAGHFIGIARPQFLVGARTRRRQCLARSCARFESTGSGHRPFAPLAHRRRRTAAVAGRRCNN